MRKTWTPLCSRGRSATEEGRRGRTGWRLSITVALLSSVFLVLGCAGPTNTPRSSTGGSAGNTGATGGAGGGNGGSTAKGGDSGSAMGGASGSAGDSSGGTGSGGWNAGGLGGDDAGGSAGTGGIDIDGGSDDANPGPSCTDKEANGDETDVDCGGTCPKCGAGKTCKADGDCRSGSCTTGKCADPFVPTGTITNNGNIWTITAGATVLEVQTNGGKVTTFSLGGSNVLVINDAATGSLFWVAPQSEWGSTNGWPPPPEMDENAPFTATAKDNVLTMTGQPGTDGLSISKRFWVNAEHQVVTLEYTFKNGTSSAMKKAPWEVTRVYPGGLTFFPYAEVPEGMAGACNCFKPLAFTTDAGVAWFKYQKADFTQDIKGGADGAEGWAAHVACGAGLERACASGTKSLVLIKEWDDATTQAPGEKEVEIFANAGHNYVEFEQMGNYQSVPAGATVVWTMRWMLRTLPSDVSATAGSAELVKWVRSQLL